MSKTTLEYGIENKLTEFISKQRGKKITELGVNVMVSEIEQEIANYCSISLNGIKAIKLKKTTPSLPLALKIAEYFNVNITDIFKLEGEEVKITTPVLVKVKFHNGKKCKVDGCGMDVFFKDLCNSHYMKNRRHGSPTFKVSRVKKCKCGKPHYAKGHCQVCYHQNYVKQASIK